MKVGACGFVKYIGDIFGGHFMLGKGSYIMECKSMHGRVG